MKNKRTIFTSIFLFTFFILIIVWLKYVPVDKISILKNKNHPVSKILCAYPVKAGSDALEPFIKHGETVNFNKCYEKENLEVGDIVVFQDGDNPRIGIIRHIINRGRLFYKVSDEKRSQEINDVLPNAIIAVSKTDTSNSQYRPSEETAIIDDDLESYMSEAYLATIPKGAGIESATLKRTTQFDFKKEKFCFIFNPIKELSGVDFTVSEKGSEKEYFFARGASLSIGENINCEEEPAGLKTGNYEFKIYKDNILLKTIGFEIL